MALNKKRTKLLLGLVIAIITGLVIGLTLYFCLRGGHYAYIINWGPKYVPTNGEVWPAPQKEHKSEKYYILQPKLFNFSVKNHSCDILENAINRYNSVLTDLYGMRYTNKNRDIYVMSLPEVRRHRNDSNYRGFITNIDIILNSECEQYPRMNMDENYLLKISGRSYIKSDSIWGILRGLESFSQLFYFANEYSELRINKTEIQDYPAYKYRGLLIDTGRHYLSVSVILKMIDALAINKMNVLHWHIVDDQSFPYESEKFPLLSEKGAFHPSLVYHKTDIAIIIEYARLRGIRVIPEFDVPGHTQSWGKAYPNLLTECFRRNTNIGLGPINPINQEVYTLLRQLYGEIVKLFPDDYLHIGGDEVDLNCWASNPTINEYMKNNGLTVQQLHAEFINHTLSLLPEKTKPIVWQEVFDNNAIKRNTPFYVQVWKYKWIEEMILVLEAGHYVIFSSSWYLDYLSLEWDKLYEADPRQMIYDATNDERFLQNVVGGEACMWGEMVDNVNALSRTWPRASAVAERLWTGLNYKARETSDIMKADEWNNRNRMEEHTCRMNRRGIPTQPPNGPGFCFGSRF